MTIALIVLHTGPDENNPRADTAIRLSGAMLADNKDVRLFLAGQGVLLLKNAEARIERSTGCQKKLRLHIIKAMRF